VLDLWLIRHGETIWNAEGRIQGQLDAPLSDLGVRQVQALAKRLTRKSFDTIYSSDSGRATQTAKILFPTRDLLLDKRLREMHYGILEGKTRAEFTPEQEAAYLAYKRNPFYYQSPDAEGENWQTLSKRVNVWIESLPEDGSVVAVTHGGVVRAALWWLVSQATSYKWNARIDNSSITRFALSSEQKVLITFNDAAHLEGLEDYDD
jgi:2,3-bisphosphoglycerate-dependent phosphoglycerate mutase